MMFTQVADVVANDGEQIVVALAGSDKETKDSSRQQLRAHLWR